MATTLGESAIVDTLHYDKLEPPVSTTGKKFKVQDSKTVSKDAVVMLNDSGEIFPIEYTGSRAFDLPIGSEHTWGAGTNPQNPTNTHFVAEKEFIINYEDPSGGTKVIGGSVDSSGIFTYGTPAVINGTNNPYTIASAIDGSTYGSATVSGVSLSHPYNGTFATAFTYTVATKTFTVGTTIQIGTVVSGYPGVAITSIDAGKYIVSCTDNKEVYLLTVSGTTTTKTTTLSVPNMYRRSAITKISDTKVVVLYCKNNWKTDAQIVNIAGNVLTLGNLATSTFDNYNNFFSTAELSLTGKFYSTNSIMSGFSVNFGLYEYSYNAGTDTISINNTPKVEPSSDFTGYDLAYYQATNRIIVSGEYASNPAILIVDYDNSTFTPQVLDFTGNGNSNSSAIDNDGDIVAIYNDNNDGKSIYGIIGDIVSNLDPTKVIGVAEEGSSGSATVLLNNSVCNASGLTVNGSVFVSQQGETSSTTSFDAINIGRALSTKEYLLKIL